MTDFEPRKLIKFGNSSFIVSLPKEWVERNNLKKGDWIYLFGDNDDELKIKAKEKKDTPEEKRMDINITKQDIYDIKREINSAYVNNFNIFSINGKNPKIKTEEIKRIFENLVGLEIVEENDNELLVKDLLDMETISPKKIVKRMDITIRSMFEELKFIKGKDLMLHQVKEIAEADKSLNRLYFLASRVVKKGLMNPSILHMLAMSNDEISSMHWLVMNLEYIGDDLKRVSRHFLEIKSSEEQKKKVGEMLSEIEKIYIDSMSYYYNNDKQNARISLSKRQSFLKKCDELGKGYKEVAAGQMIEKLKSICSNITNICRIIVY